MARNFSIGERVKHKLFGEGDIVEIDGWGENAKLTITFSEDNKVIIAKYEKLVK